MHVCLCRSIGRIKRVPFFGQESCSVAVRPPFPRALSEVRPERAREAPTAERGGGGERVNCDGKANGSQHGGGAVCVSTSDKIGKYVPRFISDHSLGRAVRTEEYVQYSSN